MIHELKYSQEAYTAVLNEWANGGRIVVKTPEGIPFGMNANDIVDIYPPNKYRDYLKSARIKRYIIDGTWYDAKNHDVIEHTPEKAKRLHQRSLKAADEEKTPEMDKDTKMDVLARQRAKLEAEGVLPKRIDDHV